MGARLGQRFSDDDNVDGKEIKYEVGDQVSVRRGSRGSVSKDREVGTVALLNPNGTYAIEYYSGNIVINKDREVAGANIEIKFEVGDQVSVRRGSASKDREVGTVTFLNPDGTYAVDYYSGNKDPEVAVANMRLYNPCKVRNKVPELPTCTSSAHIHTHAGSCTLVSERGFAVARIHSKQRVNQ